jgi:hypothetical protein
MNLSNIARGLAFGVSALLAQACSGGGDDDSASNGNGKCTTPTITGSPFVSSGTGSVHGTGTLPAGLPDGYQLELLVSTQNSSIGVLPADIFAQSNTCGRSFKYTITQVDAGTYNLTYNLYAPNSTSTDPAYMGSSTNQFTVSDGQTVEFDPTF